MLSLKRIQNPKKDKSLSKNCSSPRFLPMVEELESRIVPTVFRWEVPKANLNIAGGHNWSNKSNWEVQNRLGFWVSAGRLPATSSTIDFPAGAKNQYCNITTATGISNLNIEPGYSGTIFIFNTTLSVGSGANMDGGTVLVQREMEFWLRRIS